MRRYFVDTIAMVIFSTALGLIVEIAIAGLTVQQSIQTRAAAVPVMLLTGRPYGIYRDWLIRSVSNPGGSRLQLLLIDVVANLTFQVPLYIGLLLLNGASVRQVVTAVGTIALLSAVSGRPYGLFLVWLRSLMNVPVPQGTPPMR